MSTNLPVAAPIIEDCWNRIGISGDHSCPVLEEAIHCRNCPVFSAAAKSFFDRPAPDGYLAEWTRMLAIPEAPTRGDEVSLILFRLHGEWLALATRVVVEVTSSRPVHRIPHHSGRVLLGLVSHRGQLQLCVSLHGLLGVDPPTSSEGPDHPGGGSAARSRLVVIQEKGESWAFPADEVAGVHRLPRSQLRSVPATLANPTTSFSQAVFSWRDQTVGYLDEHRIFLALRSPGQ